MTELILRIPDSQLKKLENLRFLTGSETIQDAIMHAAINYCDLSRNNRLLAAQIKDEKYLAKSDAEIAGKLKDLFKLMEV